MKKHVVITCKKKKRYSDFLLEGGLDECGRGSLALRCYAGFCILPKQFKDNIYLKIKDSKQLSIKKRQFLSTYIKENAISWGIGYTDVDEIDEVNILNAAILAMHRAIDDAIKRFNIIPEFLLVDGNHWKSYKHNDNELPYHTIPKGDDLYMNVSSASIIAKVAHDEHVSDVLLQNPHLEVYGWKTNMCYGTQTHLDAIKKHGITEYHRKSFKTCKVTDDNKTNDDTTSNKSFHKHKSKFCLLD
jgi:ribonuclease HII